MPSLLPGRSSPRGLRGGDQAQQLAGILPSVLEADPGDRDQHDVPPAQSEEKVNTGRGDQGDSRNEVIRENQGIK